MPLLDVRQLGIVYRTPAGRVRVLDDASFSVEEGECVGLTGESGAGKTSLAASIPRLLPPTAEVTGSLRFRGTELLDLREDAMRHLRGARISLVWQEPSAALHPRLRAVDQVVEVARAHRPAPLGGERAAAHAALERAGLAGTRLAESYPHELSGGERQRVLIAQAIVCRPALVIADEPTSALDAATEAEIVALLTGLRRELGLSILWISHNRPLLDQVADRVLQIRDRRVSASPAAPSWAPRATKPGATAEGETALIEARGLRKVYPSRTFSWPRRPPRIVLDGMDLRVRRGEVVALTGVSGSGKSTLARCLARLDTPTAGEILLDGRDIGGLRGRELRAVRSAVQIIQQDPAASLPPRWTAAEAVEEPLAIQQRGTRRERRRRALDWIHEVGLPPEIADRRRWQCSGGQRARLAIARALTLEPRLLILDESLSSLDAVAQQMIAELLRRLVEQRRIGCLLIAHDPALVARVADTVAVLDGGRIVEHGPAEAVLRALAHPATRRLLAAPWERAQ